MFLRLTKNYESGPVLVNLDQVTCIVDNGSGGTRLFLPGSVDDSVNVIDAFEDVAKSVGLLTGQVLSRQTVG